MSKVTMPTPVEQQIRYFDSNALSRTYGEWSEWKMFTGKYERMGMNQKRGLITTDQAEAYAAAKVREALQWQPIETAPKDGTWVMAYRPPCEGIQMDTIVIVSWQDFE